MHGNSKNIANGHQGVCANMTTLSHLQPQGSRPKATIVCRPRHRPAAQPCLTPPRWHVMAQERLAGIAPTRQHGERAVGAEHADRQPEGLACARLAFRRSCGNQGGSRALRTSKRNWPCLLRRVWLRPCRQPLRHPRRRTRLCRQPTCQMSPVRQPWHGGPLRRPRRRWPLRPTWT